MIASAAVRRHWSRVAQLGCVITGRDAEIAHAHGPSMVERGFSKPRGKLFEYQHWLVIPLCPELHRLDVDSLDRLPATWEARYGPVAGWVDYIATVTGTDVWAKARSLMRPTVPRQWS